MITVWLRGNPLVSKSMGLEARDFDSLHSLHDLALMIKLVNIMILFVIMFMLVVSLQVHSMY